MHQANDMDLLAIIKRVVACGQAPSINKVRLYAAQQLGLHVSEQQAETILFAVQAKFTKERHDKRRAERNPPPINQHLDNILMAF